MKLANTEAEKRIRDEIHRLLTDPAPGFLAQWTFENAARFGVRLGVEMAAEKAGRREADINEYRKNYCPSQDQWGAEYAANVAGVIASDIRALAKPAEEGDGL